MKFRTSLAFLVGFLIYGLTPVAFTTVAAATCGPGAHWVDTCAAGSETLSVTLGFGVDLDGNGFPEYDALFQGTALVQHTNPIISDPSTDPTHANLAATEILSMDLTGSGGMLDGTRVIAGIDQGITSRSTGYLLEVDGDPSRATSYFNFFFQIRDTPAGTLHHDNGKILWVIAEIDRYPAFGTYYRHTGCCFGTFIPMHDESGAVAFTVSDLTSGARPYMLFAPVPLPSSVILLVSGLFGLIGMSLRVSCA